MPWFRIDDQSATHDKVVDAGNAAWGAFCRMGAHSANRGTDGFIPAATARLYASEEELIALVRVRLLDIVDGGYRLHDYLEWNPSAAEIDAMKRARSKAGKKGGETSGFSRRGKRKASASPLASAPALAPAPSPPSSPAQQRGSGNGDQEDLGEGEGGEGDLADEEALPPVVHTERPSGVVPSPDVRVIADPVLEPEAKGPIDANYWRLCQDAWFREYERAVADELGQSWGLNEKTWRSFKKAVETFCVGDARKDVQRWLYAEVRWFVHAASHGNTAAKFWSDWQPDGFLKWRNGHEDYRPRPAHFPPDPFAPKPATAKPRASARLEPPPLSHEENAAAARQILAMIERGKRHAG